MLESCGYIYDGRGNWRSPLQRGKSYATKIFDDKWFSLSTSDGSVGAPAKSGGRFGDAFDLFVCYQHGGDHKAAFRELGAQQRASMAADTREIRAGATGSTEMPDDSCDEAFESAVRSFEREDVGVDVDDVRDEKNYTDVDASKSSPQDFEQALVALDGDAQNKEKIAAAVRLFTGLDAIGKALEEARLCKATGLSKSNLRAVGAEIAKAENGLSDLTHSEMADILLRQHQKKADVPVGNAGALFFYDKSGVWKKKTFEEMRVLIGRRFRKQHNAKRNSDYGGVVNLVYQSVLDENFFTSAYPGICTEKGFWKVSGKDVVMVPHSKENRARFQLKVEPDFSSEPSLFLSVLNDAFYDFIDHVQAEEQVRLVRQMFGAAILGLQPGLQRAVFLFGASGSGKSIALRVLEALFNPEDVTVVSPHELDQDYKKASLAHMRLNIVPELDADQPIPSAAFKAALGEDRLNARLPYQVPVTCR